MHKELDDLIRPAPPPTLDDVSITMDDRRLDTKESALAFLAETEAERAFCLTVDDLQEPLPRSLPAP
ncbi:MAG: hypothetical protein M3083_08690 [Actinomycetota bacterium]|nr:hypothetical protein [Actinomycetota bacterium]